MRKYAIASLLTASVGLFSFAGCGTSDDVSKGGGHATGSGDVCGGCDVEGDVQYDENGFVVGYCGSCEDPVPLPSEIPPPDATPSPDPSPSPSPSPSPTPGPTPTSTPAGFTSNLDGNKTKKQCEEEYWKGIAACDDELKSSINKCDTDNANVALDCLREKCGTTSPTHYCVIQNRNACTQKKLDAIQACAKEANNEHARCKQSVWLDWSSCYRDASNRVSAILRWISPFK